MSHNKSTQRLVEALREVNDPALEEVIKRAEKEYYHDFQSPIAIPEIELIHDLMVRNHYALANRVRDGEFDATREEAEEWINSPEGQELIQDFKDEINVRFRDL